MTVNSYFNHISHQNQQDLVDDLIEESIQLRGIDVTYLIRDKVNEDQLLGEAPASEFNNGIIIEMYLEEIEQFNGDGDFFTQFHLEMRDIATFIVSQSRFTTEFSAHNMPKPLEGDLIYIPFSKSLFEIKKVKEDDSYHQWGKNYKWRLKCELFEPSNESIDIDNTSGDFTGLLSTVQAIDDYDENYDNIIETEFDSDVDTGDNENPFGLEW